MKGKLEDHGECSQEPPTQPYSLGIFSIATNLYVEYWKQLAVSVDHFLDGFTSVRMYVFTDSPSEVRRLAESLSRVDAKPIRIPNLTWPDATILRYQLICDLSPEAADDVLVWMDADMIVESRLTPNVLHADAWNGHLAFVKHPGFTRESFESTSRQRLSGKYWLKRFIQDVYPPSRGAWEHRLASTAYVPRSKRKKYVAGGIWFGWKSQFLAMCRLLADRIQEDSKSGITAKWHDESHLNWYLAFHAASLLGPEFCSPEGKILTRQRKPIVVARDKGDQRTR